MRQPTEPTLPSMWSGLTPEQSAFVRPAPALGSRDRARYEASPAKNGCAGATEPLAQSAGQDRLAVAKAIAGVLLSRARREMMFAYSNDKCYQCLIASSCWRWFWLSGFLQPVVAVFLGDIFAILFVAIYAYFVCATALICSSNQFSTCKPGTRKNSRTLRVTTVKSWASAMPAMSKS